MRIFVTGGTGFIGSHFIKMALSQGHEVIALKRPGSLPRINLEVEPEWTVGDLETVDTDHLKGCDTLIHLASYGVDPRESDWSENFRWNVAASFKLWQNAIAAGIKRLIICGSCSEYGRTGEEVDNISVDAPLKPVSPYAASKASATMLAMGLAASEGIEVLVVRPFQVYGEGESQHRLWPSLKKAALSGEDFEMTAGHQVRDFVPVEKIAESLLESITEELNSGEALIRNYGSGKEKTILDFSQEWWAYWKAKGKLKIGAIPYRYNEVMRFVPESPKKSDNVHRSKMP